MAKSTTPKIKCKKCKTEFKAGPHWRTRPSKYCSNACRMSALNDLPKWNKGMQSRRLNAKGYVRILVDGSLKMEHRIVMEKVIGRPLSSAERVHHLNGDRADNRPENLVLCATQSEHLKNWHPDLGKNFHRV